jgi:PilZ domain
MANWVLRMLQKPPQGERSAFGRRESCIRAVIEIAGRPPVHCIVRNFSRGGALLEVPEAIAIDDDLHLVIESHGIATYCDVRHRNGNHIGVRFLNELTEDGVTTLAKPAKEPASDPVSGASLRKSLFGTSPATEEPVLVRSFNGNAVLRQS